MSAVVVLSQTFHDDPPRDGWRGVAWQPAVECVYCGLRVGGGTGPELRKVKNEHREVCPA